MRENLAALTLSLMLSFGFAVAKQAAASCPIPAVAPRSAGPIAPRSTPRQDEIDQRVARQAQERSYAAIAFGDSNMFGWPVSMLSQALNRPVLNAAVGGGTQTLLWELKTIDFSNQKPDIAVLLVGANDLGFSSCDVYWGIRASVTATHASFPKARVVVVSILPHGENLSLKINEINEVNDELKAGAGSEYIYLDAHDSFTCSYHTPCPLYKNDTYHLNRTGFTLLGRLLHDLVASNAL